MMDFDAPALLDPAVNGERNRLPLSTVLLVTT
jgi:hypothetical protein